MVDKIKSKADRAVDLLLPLMIGVVACYSVIGTSTLSPHVINWLSNDDMATHYLGWVFYRHGPWGFPLGLNPDYGMEISSSIVFSDSLPLFSIPLKFFSGWLPEPFQFTGIWLASCFIFQAWFAWKLVGLIAPNRLFRSFATSLLVFSPPMLTRLAGHMTLVGHFVILAALYLSLNPHQTNRLRWWTALVIITTLIHPYLLLMVGALWFADWIGQQLRGLGELQWSKVVIEPFVVTVAIGLTAWQAGYFTAGPDVGQGGFGFHRMNVWSLINAQGWSRIIQTIPVGLGDYEGFNYLGLGSLLLIALILPVIVERRVFLRKLITYRPVLFVALVALTLLSLSNNVGVGTTNYFFPLPIWASGISKVFRASGRMFWPVYYVLLFSLVYVVARGYRPRAATWLLGIVLVAQIVDTSPAWTSIRDVYAAKGQAVTTSLKSEFWREATERYRRIQVILPVQTHPGWRVLATVAAQAKMKTDAVYLARIDSDKLAAARIEADRRFDTHDLDPESLYVLDENKVLLALVHGDQHADLIAAIDGFNVVAPGWKSCTSCTFKATELRLDDRLSYFQAGEQINYVVQGVGAKTLLYGWAGAEPGGVWTNEREAELVIAYRGVRPREMMINAHAFLSSELPQQTVEMRINNGPVHRIVFDASTRMPIVLPIPAPSSTDVAESALDVHLSLLNPARPIDLQLSSDNRLLGISLTSITLMQ